MRRVWQAAATVGSVLRPGLLDRAARSGLRSLFVGFETINPGGLVGQNKIQNLGLDYAAAIQALRDHGVMVNASFVFGTDDDGPDVFARTVDWAVDQGIETATFHILTPYPGTRLHRSLLAQGRILHADWQRYDTRHATFLPARMSPEQLEAGYRRAYRDFYRWGSIVRAACRKPHAEGMLRHLAYSGGWKKLEPLWNVLIQAGQLPRTRPILERVLQGWDRRGAAARAAAVPLESDGFVTLAAPSGPGDGQKAAECAALITADGGPSTQAPARPPPHRAVVRPGRTPGSR